MSATRSGDLDPEIVLFVLAHPDWDADAVRNMLTHRSGIAAFSVASSTCATCSRPGPTPEWILPFARSPDRWRWRLHPAPPHSTSGMHWCSREESASIPVEIREEICARLLSLPGAVADARSPSASASDQLAARGIRVLTVAADEEAVMDRQTRELLWP